MGITWDIRSYQGSELSFDGKEWIICKTWKFAACSWMRKPKWCWYRAKYDGHPYICFRIGWIMLSWGEQGEWLPIE